MNKFSALFLTVVLASACRTAGDPSTDSNEAQSGTSGLVTLDDDESQLRNMFDANSEKTQLLVILSPT